MITFPRPANRLHGVYILVAADFSVGGPQDKGDRPLRDEITIERSLVAIARAVFGAGGRLATPLHETFTHLLAQISAEYRLPRLAEERERPPEEDEDPRLQSLLMLLPSLRLGGERLPQTDFLFDGNFVTEAWKTWSEHSGDPFQLLKKIDPAAMVCIGGQDDVLKMAHIFREAIGDPEDRPIYPVGITKGDAAKLSEYDQEWKSVRNLDREIMAKVEPAREEWRALVRGDGDELPIDESGVDDPVPHYPFPLIMQRIIDDIGYIDDIGDLVG